MDLLQVGRSVFEQEAAEIAALGQGLTEEFSDVVTVMEQAAGKIVVCGVGKSGIISHKISASLASTGTPSFFLHASEAIHGDLGMVEKEDVLLAVSYSGETEEVLKVIPFFQKNRNTIISITGNSESTLAKNSDYHLDVRVKSEVCPLDLAPTTSATATLVMGDALVVALMRLRGFQAVDFVNFHPGGSIGKRLLTKVSDVMISKELPVVDRDIGLAHVLQTMDNGRLGLVVVTEKSQVCGVITDGDIRRCLMTSDASLLIKRKASEVMSDRPLLVGKDLLLTDAEDLMRAQKVNSLLVAEDNCLIGIVPFKKVF